jgi:hypothetical protein
MYLGASRAWHYQCCNLLLGPYVARELKGYLENSSHHVLNSVEFIHTIKSLHAGPEDIPVSFVISLFTMTPTGKGLHLLTCNSHEDILRLLCHILTPFLFPFQW